MSPKPVQMFAALALTSALLAPAAVTAQVFDVSEVAGPNGRVFYTYPAGSAMSVPGLDPWAYGYPFTALASALNFYSGTPHPAILPAAYYYAGVPEPLVTGPYTTLSFTSLGGPGAVPPAAAPAPAPPESAVGVIDVRVPPDAKLWVEGKLTSQKGARRRFVSPSLDQGSSYTYRVRATWSEKGHNVSREQFVVIHAGDRESITFVDPRAPASVGKTARP